MSKLIMWNLMTLDGFFDGAENWALDWHQYAWGEELERMSIEQLRVADMLLFGRKLSRLRMKLLESRPLASGSVLLRYAPFAE